MLYDVATQVRCEVFAGSAAWHAALEWCRFHGLDPDRIPFGSVIERDAERFEIRYELLERDDAGKIAVREGRPVVVPAVERGEAPPLPFPAEVLA